MIIMRLVGGLGNQMFQYALGRSLSIRYNRPLKLDISGYVAKVGDPMKGTRLYGLNYFKIDEHIATLNDLKPFLEWKSPNMWRKILKRLPSFRTYFQKKYIIEPKSFYFRFDRRLLEEKLAEPTAYLDGYWQTEKYFSSIESIIHQDFTLKNAAEGKNLIIANEIKLNQSVCIHIRHGDNATGAAKLHGVLPMNYYYDAVQQISASLKDPHFYIFSDDPDWAKKNLILSYKSTFIDHNGDSKNHEDLRLMTYCKHHIIGNSTFSWWAAWLGRKPGQIVFAPREYHLHTKILPKDLYPGHWNVLDVKDNIGK